MQNDLPVWSDHSRALVPGMYRHYKGGIYEVIGIAPHSETLEEMGVYTHDGKMWVRPIAIFLMWWSGRENKWCGLKKIISSLKEGAIGLLLQAPQDRWSRRNRAKRATASLDTGFH